MCSPPNDKKLSQQDAAERLANIINGCAITHTTGAAGFCEKRISAYSVRALIRNDWSKLCALAHQVHDEETSAFRREQRKALAEVDDYAKYG